MAMICGEVTDALVIKSVSLFVSESERQALIQPLKTIQI